MTRLLAPAERRSKTFTVEKGLDFVKGDKLGLMPTSYKPRTHDSVVVKKYDNETGVVEIESPLKFYHWGQENSTGPDYEGIDMRGEVVLLSRNILIQGTDTDGWGC